MNRLTASEGTLAVYKDLWQLEVWLRRLVYIELKTKYGRTLEAQFDKAKDFLKKSQAYHHMPAAEGELVSYMLMRGLLIMIERHWDLFEPYLMPQKQWDARMDEIEHIRNRVAHFRHGHSDDHERVKQLLRDLDPKFWSLCVSLDELEVVMFDDPVVTAFTTLEDMPYRRLDDGRLLRCGSSDPTMTTAFQLSVFKRPWAPLERDAAGREGYFYRAHFYAKGGRYVQFPEVLRQTRRLHDDVLFIAHDGNASNVTLLIPAVIGSPHVTDAINGFYDACLNATRHGPPPYTSEAIDAFALSQPEFVLVGFDPLLNTSRDMPFTIFGA